MYVGDLNPSVILDKKFFTVNTAQAPTTLGGTPTVAVLKSNSTSLTTAGITLTTDFGGRTGSNHLRIDLAQDTAFYASGNDFDAILTAGSVGGTSVVGAPLVSFSVRNRSPLRPDSLTTSTVGAVSGAVGSVGSNVTAASVASNVTAVVSGNITGSVANLTNITGPVTLTTNLDKGGYTAAVSGNITGSVANLTNITGPVTVTTNLDKSLYTSVVSGNITGSVALVNTLTTYTGNTPQTGDAFLRLGAGGVSLNAIPNITGSVASVTGSVNSVATNVTAAAVLGNITGTVARVTLTDTLTTYTGNTPQTGDVYSRVGAAGAGLTALGDTRLNNLDQSVSSILTGTMTEAYAGTGVPMSLAQSQFMLHSFLMEFGIVGTVYTTKKKNQSTTAMIYALDSATTPTAISRTS